MFAFVFIFIFIRRYFWMFARCFFIFRHFAHFSDLSLFFTGRVAVSLSRFCMKQHTRMIIYFEIFRAAGAIAYSILKGMWKRPRGHVENLYEVLYESENSARRGFCQSSSVFGNLMQMCKDGPRTDRAGNQEEGRRNRLNRPEFKEGNRTRKFWSLPPSYDQRQQ